MSENLLEVQRPYWAQGEYNENWPLNKHSNKYEAAIQVKSGAGKLYGFTVYNSSASTQFIQVHDSQRAPAAGDIPCLVFPIATVSTVFVGFADVGRAFNSGIWLANSSTGPTFTAGSADCFYDAQYI